MIPTTTKNVKNHGCHVQRSVGRDRKPENTTDFLGTIEATETTMTSIRGDHPGQTSRNQKKNETNQDPICERIDVNFHKSSFDILLLNWNQNYYQLVIYSKYSQRMLSFVYYE